MKRVFLALSCSLMLCLSLAAAHAAEEKWKGVDDTVVGKYAQEKGHPAKNPFIAIEGDSALFAFLVAGAVGGFILGYYFRELMTKNDAGRKADAL